MSAAFASCLLTIQNYYLLSMLFIQSSLKACAYKHSLGRPSEPSTCFLLQVRAHKAISDREGDSGDREGQASGRAAATGGGVAGQDWGHLGRSGQHGHPSCCPRQQSRCVLPLACHCRHLEEQDLGTLQLMVPQLRILVCIGCSNVHCILPRRYSSMSCSDRKSQAPRQQDDKDKAPGGKCAVQISHLSPAPAAGVSSLPPSELLKDAHAGLAHPCWPRGLDCWRGLKTARRIGESL